MIAVLEKSMSVDDLKINLSATTGHSLVDGKTILFIDEVQEAKDIVTKIKFWVDDGRYRYVLSGSLLGVELSSLRSAPVGYLEEITMFPMDFEEFLVASGVTDEVIAYLKRCFAEESYVNEPVHKGMLKHFYRYLVVGGMPAAVQEYVISGDIGKVSSIQRNIISLYKNDFTKYETQKKKLMLVAVYDQIPSNLLRQNKRFHYADIKKGLRFERMENSFLWLCSAGVAIPAYNATEPRVSLNQNRKQSLVKLYSSDVGLLTLQYGDAMRLKILMQDEKVNLGGVFENAVVQQLAAHSFEPYFYNNNRIGELDFIIEEAAEVVPIEVKSGKDYKIHSAMSRVCSNDEYDISKAYVFSNYNFSLNGKVRYMPVYMCTFLNGRLEMPVYGGVNGDES